MQTKTGSGPGSTQNKAAFASSILGKLGLSPLSAGAFAFLSLAPFLIQDEYYLRIVISSLMFGTLAMGFDLSAGFISVANWGYAGLMGVSAYTSGLLLMKLGISPWIGIFAGALLAACLGMLIALLTMRMSDIFASVMAWFLGLILMSLAAQLTDLTRGMAGLNVNLFFETAWGRPYFYVIFLICLITFMCLRLMTTSKLGLAFKAIGQDVEAARTSGVDPLKYKLINFTVSSFIAGIVGGFYAHFIGILTPDMMATKHTVEVLVIAYIGGRGSIWGPLLAAFLIIPLFEILSFLVELKFVLYGLLLILVMIFYPGGIAALGNSISKKIKDISIFRNKPNTQDKNI